MTKQLKKKQKGPTLNYLEPTQAVRNKRRELQEECIPRIQKINQKTRNRIQGSQTMELKTPQIPTSKMMSHTMDLRKITKPAIVSEKISEKEFELLDLSSSSSSLDDSDARRGTESTIRARMNKITKIVKTPKYLRSQPPKKQEQLKIPIQAFPVQNVPKKQIVMPAVKSLMNAMADFAHSKSPIKERREERRPTQKQQFRAPQIVTTPPKQAFNATSQNFKLIRTETPVRQRLVIASP